MVGPPLAVCEDQVLRNQRGRKGVGLHFGLRRLGSILHAETQVPQKDMSQLMGDGVAQFLFRHPAVNQDDRVFGYNRSRSLTLRRQMEHICNFRDSIIGQHADPPVFADFCEGNVRHFQKPP
jgi:hypothetical protein